MPEELDWPTVMVRDEDGESYDDPLTFVCQIRCADIAPFDPHELLPHEGMLYFFAAIDYFLGDFDTLSLKSVNPKQIEQQERFTIERDSLNIRRYIIKPDVQVMQGYEYIFKVPYRSFRDINGHWNDSTQVKVSLPNDETLSTFTLNVSDVDRKFIVEMLDEKKANVIRQFIIDSDSALLFPYLKAGKYCIRITEDANRNGIVDTGNLLGHRQPEKVKFLRTNDSDSFDIPERSEIVQELNMSEFMGFKKENSSDGND